MRVRSAATPNLSRMEASVYRLCFLDAAVTANPLFSRHDLRQAESLAYR